MAEIAVALPAVPESIRRARALVDGLRGILNQGQLEDLRLIVSELVTNSIRHAELRPGDAIELLVSVGDTICLELRDPGRGFEPTESPPMFEDAGWGLFLVSQLTDRWGVRTDGGSTTVWIEIPRNATVRP